MASISHELRTPIDIILGYTEMLLDTETSASLVERDRLVRRAREAACGLMHLVDSVLDLGKLDAGRVPVEVEAFALGPWAAEQRDRDRMPLHDGVRLEWHLPPTLPQIKTDRAKLCIVLDNLVNNAIKFTVRGVIAVHVRHLVESDAVEFRVDDTGPGIAGGDLRRIFAPFEQAAAAKSRTQGGVGLGLAIVDRYVTPLGGRVAVESTLGVGTRFRVTLPCSPVEATRAVAGPRAAA